MWKSFLEWVRRLFNKRPNEGSEPESHAKRYEDITGENITATIVNKLSKLVFSDSLFEVDDDGARADLVRSVLNELWEDTGWITAQMLGKGGKVIVPTINGGKISVNVLNQDRLFISGMKGRRITSATLLADTGVVEGHHYYRWVDYTVDDNGAQIILNRATDHSGREVPLGLIPEWGNIEPEITIANTDRPLFAFLKCPRDNRRDDKVYGVPVTYGAERDISELVEHLNIYRREYRLTRPMLGLDSSMWSNKTDYTPSRIGIDDVRRTVQDGDDPFIPISRANIGDGGKWEYYAPAIRSEAMETRLQTLYRRVERSCGLSQGILTDRQQQNYANRDEVRAAMYDTFSVVCEIRRAWEMAFNDIAYAVDVLAERFGITPTGTREPVSVSFDWDTSMIESSTEAFSQLSELQSMGAAYKAELRQWVRGGTLEDAKKAVEDITKTERAMAPAFGLDDGNEDEPTGE